ESNSHALITTPGSTKYYRSAGEFAQVKQNLSVQDDACLEWFPQENIFFPGSKVKIRTEIHLSNNAGFMGWEISCLGRPASDEIFDTGNLDSGLLIYRDKKVIFNERQRIFRLKHLSSAAGLRNHPMSAVFVATGCDESAVDQAREIVSLLKPGFPVGITLLGDLLVLRALGESAEKLQKIMIPVWQMLRFKIVNKKAITPRIWLT
ncbi:MAG: urease accessory protein UreD, partial [Gammaproteobacteria bacterium]|nr:urease accessory protein UreD [Gammaproteobacteria bacterium]